jgi:ferric-dicitrate binding protein FerR (iron transport regulator)
MDEDVDWALLGTYLFGECTEREEARVHAWIEEDPKRRVILGQLRKILRATDDSPSAEELDADALWERVDRETRQGDEERSPAPGRSGSKRPRSRRRVSRPGSRESTLRKVVWPGAVAAILAVTITLWLFGPLESGLREPSSPSPETFVTQKGQRTSVRLSDGSQVRLNVDSRLTVPSSFGNQKRVVHLEGEAFFEVRGDSTRPFIVRSEGAATRALGTAFNVGAYPEDEEIKVVVAEGRVSLQAEEFPEQGGDDRQEGQQDVVLTQNQVSLISRSGGQIIQREDDLSEHLAWMDGQLTFDDAPFDEVVRRLERWYDLEIMLGENSPLPSGHLNAQFDKDRPLSDVLLVIGAAFDVRHERDGDRVTFFTSTD